MKQEKITFFRKDKSECPVCENTFMREELRSGRGRLIAGKLTSELHRQYEVSRKYGHIYPLIYPVIVCPKCLFAIFAEDAKVFMIKKPFKILQSIKEDADRRKSMLTSLLGKLDFTQPRDLTSGLASYILAVLTYEKTSKSFIPTFKQGLASLRAAWLANDLAQQEPNKNWDYLSMVMYRKANYFYKASLIKEENAEERTSSVRSFGPDEDKNYGFEGVTYLAALLEYRYGPRFPQNLRIESLNKAKITISNVFGVGQSSKGKPGAILDHARDVFENISSELASYVESSSAE